ncbi:hypothetical protein D3OALGA1CA_4583, partial [Olavius algarvensis associated proteobacterium Delta 3]
MLPQTDEVAFGDDLCFEEDSLQDEPAYDPSQSIDDIFAVLTGNLLMDDTPEDAGDHTGRIDDLPAGVREDSNAVAGTRLETCDGAGDASTKPLEIIDTRLAKPVYDYFGDATDPPKEGAIGALQDSAAYDPDTANSDVSNRYNIEFDEIRNEQNYSVTREGEMRPQEIGVSWADYYTLSLVLHNLDIYSPGNSPGIVNVAEFTQNSDATLVIEIGGLTPGPGNPADNGYDQINVAGAAILDGSLRVVLINNFEPALGTTFDFLTFGSLSGSFSQTIVPWGFSSGNHYFEIEEQSDRLQLVVAEMPPEIPDGINLAPVAIEDTASTDEDVPLPIDVLANDYDNDGGVLIVDSVTQPANGTATINADNTVTYTPDPNYHGSDSFTYTIDDGDGGLDNATVTITVIPVEDGFVYEGRDNDSLANATPLTLVEDPAGRGLFVTDQRGLGSIDPTSDGDWWSFPGQAGDRVAISADTPNSGLRTWVGMYNSSGGNLTANASSGPDNDGFISDYPLTSTDTYYVFVQRQGGSSVGEYQLRIEKTQGIDLESDADYNNDSFSGADPVTLTEAGNQRTGAIA